MTGMQAMAWSFWQLQIFTASILSPFSPPLYHFSSPHPSVLDFLCLNPMFIAVDLYVIHESCSQKKARDFFSFCSEELAVIFRNFLVDYYEFWKLADQFYWIFQGAEQLVLKYKQRTQIIPVTNMFMVCELCNSRWPFSNHWLHGIISVLIIIIVCSFLCLFIY